jgi:glucose-6-phosphate 1-epimerase
MMISRGKGSCDAGRGAYRRIRHCRHSRFRRNGTRAGQGHDLARRCGGRAFPARSAPDRLAAAGRAAGPLHEPNSAFAPGRAIRGGIPIIFPWFGANRHEPAAPQHGFARTASWHLDGVETRGSQSLTLTFSLGDGDVGSPFWPEPFRAIYTVTFAQTLSLRLTVQNRATRPIIFEEALHAYFAISDISTIAISGLAGTTYIDKTDAARRKEQTAALVTITAETDRVYLDTPGRCAIEDRGWRHRVVIEKDGAASGVVWNPWAEKAAAMVDLGDPAWRGMVCVETGNVADNEVRLAADDEHQMSTVISVDAGP